MSFHKTPQTIISKIYFSWRTEYMYKSTNIWYQRTFNSFSSESNFDLITALNQETSVIKINNLSIFCRKQVALFSSIYLKEH